MAVIEKDIIDVICEELFTVRFVHSGFGFSRRNFISESIKLEPDRATKILFRNHYMDYRFYNDTLICFIRIELLSPPAFEPGRPYIKFPGDVLIRFLIDASPDFLSKTQVIAAGSRQVYQFSNRVNAGTGGCISMQAGGVDNNDLKNADVLNIERPCFGVIDIHSTGAINNSYRLFDVPATQQLNSPDYLIPFISLIT